jgi:hypothetical protein
MPYYSGIEQRATGIRKMTTYNILTRDAQGNVKVTNRLAKMAPYLRRSIYKHAEQVVAGVERQVFWSAQSGACEGVSVARYVA